MPNGAVASSATHDQELAEGPQPRGARHESETLPRGSHRLASVDHKLLVQAIVTAFMSYDHASDADVDPDWAVKIMENLVDTLNQLSDVDRALFRADLRSLADDLDDDPFYAPWRNYYGDFPRLIGWDEPSQA